MQIHSKYRINLTASKSKILLNIRLKTRRIRSHSGKVIFGIWIFWFHFFKLKKLALCFKFKAILLKISQTRCNHHWTSKRFYFVKDTYFVYYSFCTNRIEKEMRIIFFRTKTKIKTMFLQRAWFSLTFSSSSSSSCFCQSKTNKKTFAASIFIELVSFFVSIRIIIIRKLFWMILKTRKF